MTLSIGPNESHSDEVGPDGPNTARVVVLTEYPGAWEIKEGIPLVGPPGNLFFDDILGRAGIRRNDCLVVNFYWQQPTRNKWETVSNPLQYADRVREIIHEHPRDLIIAVGSIALEFLTGDTSIYSWRGSIVESAEFGCKILPIIHPRDVLKTWSWLPLSRLDAVRAKRILDSPETMIDVPRKVTNFAESTRRHGGSRELAYTEFLDLLTEYRDAPALSFDIETFQGTITCIGLARSRSDSICVPLTGQFNRWQERELLKKLKEALEGPSLKVGQNLDYDVQYLVKLGIGVRNVWIDTMVAHSCMHPEMRHDLATLTSLYTLKPYFKEMRKEAISGAYNETMWEYNGYDCCVTLEIAIALHEELRRTGVLSLFETISMPVTKTLVRMEHTGVRIDDELRVARKQELSSQIETLMEDPKLGGVNPNSPKQVKDYLRENLPSSVYKTVKATDVHALKSLRLKRPALGDFIDTILEVRALRKIVGTYLGADAHEDGRIRTSYRTSATDTGRLSSSKDVFGKGMNLQNVPFDQRDWFIPSTDMVFWDADASQIEARITAWIAQDENYIQGFLQDRDLHAENAAQLFGIPQEKVQETIPGSTDSYRDVGKRATHAMNYKVGPKKLKDMMNEAVPTLPFAMKDAYHFQDTFKKIRPGVARWWIRVDEHLKKTRKMVTPYGRQRIFQDRLGDQLLRAAVAFMPQSTAADHINKALVAIEKRLAEEIPTARVLLQVHDSIGGECYPSDVEDVRRIVIEEMEKPLPLVWREKTLVVPAEFASGPSWKDCK